MRLIWGGEKGEGRGAWRWREREMEIIYLSLHCHHQNDLCIKMGSDESHFNASVGSDGQSHKTVSSSHNLSEKKGETKRYRTEVEPRSNRGPSAYQPNALPLGQTGLLHLMMMMIAFIQRYSPLSSRLTALACDST